MADWDGSMPDLTPFPGAGSAGAVVIGGVWADEPAATKEAAPTAPDPFDF